MSDPSQGPRRWCAGARRPLRGGRFLLPLLMLLFMPWGSVWAQALDSGQMKLWDVRLEIFEKRISEGTLSEDLRRFYRDQTGQIILEATAFRNSAADREEQIRAQLNSLGPMPEGGAPAEDPALTNKREELNKELAAVAGWTRRADLLVIRGEQIIDQLATISREKLKEDLLRRGPTPLSINSWLTAVGESVRLAQASFITGPLDWWDRMKDRTSFVVQLLILTLILGTLGQLGRRRLLARFRRDKSVEMPFASMRLISGLAEAVARDLMPALVTLGLLYLAVGIGPMDERISAVGRALFRNLALMFVGLGVIKAIFATNAPQWNLITVPPRLGVILTFRLRLILSSFLAMGFILGSFQWATISPELLAVLSLIYGIAVVVPAIGLTRPALWTTLDSEEPTKDVRDSGASPANARVQAGAVFWNLVSLSLLAIPLSAVLGYSHLAIQLADSLVLSLMVTGVAILVRFAYRVSLKELLEGAQPLSATLRKNLSITRDGAVRLTFWFGLFGDVVIVLTAVLVVLPTIGFGTDETIDWVGRVMRGIELGGFTLSLSNIILGVGAFSLVLIVTGLIKRGLDTHILPNVTRDRGIREALKSGVGYAGFVIAALVAVGVAGIDLSNLAIIAGALSVGIGFGLQNVVNNFVSGLILLIERPIKPGDWVVIGGHEGTVKKVNVRSTEIETFQRASVIIPNADLLSNAVTNWTYKDMTARLELQVGVDYDSDVDKVAEILLAAARAHPRINSYPEPYVLFKDFGASSLDFELRAYLTSVDYWITSMSDLRFEIFRNFKEAGITIPYNQMVMHIQRDGEFPPPQPKPDT